VTPLLLGIRWAVHGDGRDRWRQLTVVVAAAATTVALLVFALMSSVLDARADRMSARTASPRGTESAALVAHETDEWRGQAITRILVADGAAIEPPPGVDALPDVGATVLSPRLRTLTIDNASLRAAYAVDVAGEIGQDGLAGPDELVAYVGVTRAELEQRSDVARVDGFGNSSIEPPLQPDRGRARRSLLVAGGFTTVLFVLFLASAYRLAARSRERRIASLRLLGATVADCRRVLAGETLPSCLLGSLLGIAAFLALVAATTGDRFLGMTWYSADVPGPAALVGAAATVVAIASATAQLSGSSLGNAIATRRRAAPPLRSTARAVPLVVGFACLAAVATTVAPDGWLDALALVGVALVCIGAPLGVAVLVRRTCGALASRLRSASAQVALRRAEHEPRAIGRAAAVLASAVVALAVLSAFAQDEADADSGYGAALAADAGIVYIEGVDPAATDDVVASGRASAAVPVALRPATAADGSGSVSWGVVGDCADIRDLMGWTGSCGDGGSVRVRVADVPPERFCTDAGCEPVTPPDRWTWDDGTALPPVVGELVAPSRSDVLPELDAGLLLVPGDAGAATQTDLLIRAPVDGLGELRHLVLAADPVVHVRQPAVEADLRRSANAGARSLLVAGGVVSLVVAGLLQFVGAMDALQERRRETAVLVAIGFDPPHVRRLQLYFVLVPFALSMAVGGLGAVLSVLAIRQLAGGDAISVVDPLRMGAAVCIASGVLLWLASSIQPRFSVAAIRTE
jgi:hypothetical protein